MSFGRMRAGSTAMVTGTFALAISLLSSSRIVIAVPLHTLKTSPGLARSSIRR